jgi:hypothetical protein
LCSKEISKSEIKDMEEESVEVMCKMEQHLPPSFFDSQPHQIVHVVKEVELAGLVSYRWMYFLERYMKDLKGWVRQKAKPKGSMAQGYIIQEVVVHVTEYITRLDKESTQLWNVEVNPELYSMKVPKAHRLRRLDRDPKGRIFLQQVHAFVLKMDPCMEHWRNRFLSLTSPDWGDFGEWVSREMRTMISRGEQVPNREYHLAIGPYPKVNSLSYMWAQGKFLRLASRDTRKAM